MSIFLPHGYAGLLPRHCRLSTDIVFMLGYLPSRAILVHVNHDDEGESEDQASTPG
jgi:hypothetical protein